MRGVDQRHMRDACGKLPTILPVNVEFLGEQSHITAKGQQALEQFARFSASAEQNKVVGIPNAAGEEDTFSTASNGQSGGAAPHLPQSFIGLLPHGYKMLNQLALQIPSGLFRRPLALDWPSTSLTTPKCRVAAA